MVERGPVTAVDDVVVNLPRGRLPDSLVTAAHAVPGVVVESLRPYAGPLDTHRELELLDELAKAAEGTTAKLLAAELPRVFHCGWAVVLQSMQGKGTATGTQAAATLAQLMDGAQKNLRDGRALGPRASQAMLDTYSTLVSGVLIGMSDALRQGTSGKK